MSPSNNTFLKDFEEAHLSAHGRNFHFGAREHGMGAILNGMALHGGIRPYGATFLVFSRLHASVYSPGCFDKVAGYFRFYTR